MCVQNPLVLVFGDGERVAARPGWRIWAVDQAMDALAVVVFESPDVVVVDTGADDARTVYRHLLSADFAPALLVLTDHPETWSISNYSTTRFLSAGASPALVTGTVTALVRDETALHGLMTTVGGD
jgi:hypothetical protein